MGNRQNFTLKPPGGFYMINRHNLYHSQSLMENVNLGKRWDRDTILKTRMKASISIKLQENARQKQECHLKVVKNLPSFSCKMFA